MKNKNIALMFCLYLLSGVFSINCMDGGKLILQQPLTFEAKIESFDQVVTLMHYPPVTSLKEAEGRLTELNKQRKKLNAIQHELRLPGTDQRMVWRRQALDFYTSFYAKKVRELQEANPKKPKKRPQKKGVAVSDDSESFLDQCIALNQQQGRNTTATSTNKQSVTGPELLTKDEQRRLLVAKSREKRAELVALRARQSEYDKWCEEHPSDSESGSDSELQSSHNLMQDAPFCGIPVEIMNYAKAKAAAERSKDRIQAASLDLVWVDGGEEYNIDAYYFLTDGSTEIKLDKSGNFPPNIEVVTVMNFNENYIYLSSVATKVGCDENGIFYFMSQKYPGKAYPITNIYGIKQDPSCPMTKYFTIKKEHGQIKLQDNNGRVFRLNLDNDIEFECCDDPSKRYSLKIRDGAYHLHDKQANEEYLLFHGDNLQEQFNNIQYRNKAFGRVDCLVRQKLPQNQLMALLGKKLVELGTLL